MSKLNILFLANRPTDGTQAPTVTEYLDAVSKYSRHSVHEVSMLGIFPEKIELDRFDVVMTHYSLSLGPLINHYLGPELVEKLREYKGLKAAFLQDEYRAVHAYWKNINWIGLDLLFSCVPEDQFQVVYPKEQVPDLRIVNVLTGYVPKELLGRNSPRIADRPIDVSYRARKMQYWLGKLGREKTFIAEEFVRRSRGSGLRIDVSARESDRLYGEAWTRLVESSRAVLGVESGASIVDFDGELEHTVDAYVGANPTASFEEVFERFLKPHEGSLRLHQISPRCFEAAVLKTPMILFEGHYSGVLEPGRHYIPLKKNFENYDDVVKKLRDTEYLQEMADRTYREIALNPDYAYETFVDMLDTKIEEAIRELATRPASEPYSAAEFRKAIDSSVYYRFRRWLALEMQRIILRTPVFRRMIIWTWEVLPPWAQRQVRPWAKMISR